MAKPGRKIDAWSIRGDDGVRHKVEVRMISTLSGVTFQALLPEQGIDESHANLNELKKLVTDKLKDREACEWRSCLHVRVGGSRAGRDYRGSKLQDDELFERAPRGYWSEKWLATARVEVTVKRVQVTESNGVPRHRDLDAVRGEEPVWGRVQDDWPTVGVDEDDGEVCALVPDTEDNRRALVQVRRAIEQVTERLDRLLAPEVVEHTLAHLSHGVHLLSASYPADVETEPRKGVRRVKA